MKKIKRKKYSGNRQNITKKYLNEQTNENKK